MLGPIATLLVGVAVAFIAWQQWQVARNKLRLDLFDRRFKVYEAAKKFRDVVMQSNEFDDSCLFDFLAGTSDAEFLFDSDVLDYLAQLRKRALDWRKHILLCQSLPEGSELSQHLDAINSHRDWFLDQLTGIATVFKPYLGFSQIKVDSGLFPNDKLQN